MEMYNEGKKESYKMCIININKYHNIKHICIFFSFSLPKGTPTLGRKEFSSIGTLGSDGRVRINV